MKVVAVNGSPNEQGNTAIALGAVTDALESQGIETRTFCLGKSNIRACIGCRQCFKLKNKKCVFDDDGANEIIAAMAEADGILLASPTYFAGISGNMKGFLDRAFYVHSANDSLFRHKVGASLTVARRAGTTGAIDQLNKYLLYGEFIIASGNYWDVAFGRIPGEAAQDVEGIQTMRVLANNMAYVLRLVENGRDAISAPELEPKTPFNFIR